MNPQIPQISQIRREAFGFVPGGLIQICGFLNLCESVKSVDPMLSPRASR